MHGMNTLTSSVNRVFSGIKQVVNDFVDEKPKVDAIPNQACRLLKQESLVAQRRDDIKIAPILPKTQEARLSMEEIFGNPRKHEKKPSSGPECSSDEAFVLPRRRMIQTPSRSSPKRSSIPEQQKRSESFQARRRPASLQLTTLPEEEDSEKSNDHSRKCTPGHEPMEESLLTQFEEESIQKRHTDKLGEFEYENADDAGMDTLIKFLSKCCCSF